MTKNNTTEAGSCKPFVRAAMVALMGLGLSACTGALDRLANVGEEPALSTIDNPGAGPNGVQPISLPMPRPDQVERQPNSLWRPGSRAFLKDQRASRVGDILTVIIDIADNASINNTSTRSRTASEDSAASALLGYPQALDKIFPSDYDPTNLVDLDSESSSQGSGAVDRDETINLRVAGLITQVLPNGNLVVSGRQEVRVNYEVRELQVAGIIRPEDITSTNTIQYDQIAEARVAYGGRGHITDVQQPRYGQQVFDIIWPF
ncbi:MAG: flagellar basal body L-ring protein FlgH [Pseudomonadota bacterium]